MAIALILDEMKRVMIVDDNIMILMALSKNLAEIFNFSIEIKTVANGKDAAHEISSSFYDVCFLDVNLPDMNGIEVMMKIKEISPGTEVIIMTAEELNAEFRDKVDKLAYQFISKPFDLYEVKFILKNALEKRGCLEY